jgi:hypothetical protein
MPVTPDATHLVFSPRPSAGRDEVTMTFRPFDFFSGASVLLVWFGLAAPVAAGESGVVPMLAVGPGRLGSIAGVLAGLVGLVIGVSALRATRRVGPGAGCGGAIGALTAGSTGVVLGALVVATARGGLGTGNGLGGGVVAMVVGSLSVIVGGLARSRSRRA